MAGTRKFDEQAVLDQAINIFWGKGYIATTMLDLAKETGVQRGSLYNAYQNKNTLFLKAFDHYMDKFLSLVEEDLHHDNAYLAFEQLLRNIVERLSSDKEGKGCFSTRTIMEAAQECPEVTQCLKQFLDRLEAIIHKRLQKAIDDGQFTGHAAENARYLVALTRGIAVIERVYCDKQRMIDIYQTALHYMPFIRSTL